MIRPRFTWDLGSRQLALGGRTLVMGVLNVTPDSFSDGGRYFDTFAAVEHSLRLLEEGADILDVGGESTRPDAATEGSNAGFVSEEEELRRVLPVIRELKRRRADAIISIDTYKSGVARAAVQAGAEIVNDVSGFHWDAAMPAAIAELRCGAVLMHTRGRPDEWKTLPPVEDMVAMVSRELGDSANAALRSGIERARLVLDPGFGFGKRFDENYPLLARFEEFHALGFPLLAGPSRKSFVGRATSRGGGAAPAHERMAGSLAAAVLCIMKGAHIVRVHDVKETVDGAAMADAVLNYATR
ncbi:MAG: dihydropteroate synthase [Terriglobales bacterium]